MIVSLQKILLSWTFTGKNQRRPFIELQSSNGRLPTLVPSMTELTPPRPYWKFKLLYCLSILKLICFKACYKSKTFQTLIPYTYIYTCLVQVSLTSFFFAIYRTRCKSNKQCNITSVSIYIIHNQCNHNICFTPE